MNQRPKTGESTDARRAGPAWLTWGGLFGGPLVAVGVYALLADSGLGHEARAVAGVASLMAVWWISEAISLSATALVPLVLFPVLGVSTMGDAAAPYANQLIFLFMGGLILGLGLEKWGAHKRIALLIVCAVGSSPRRIVLGFMLAAALLSMFVSNTATAAMMMPIGVSVVVLASAGGDGGGLDGKVFGPALMLGIAYGCSAGGLATIIGTPPNGVLVGVMRDTLGEEITFARWMRLGLPLTCVLLPVVWVMLVFVLYPLRDGAIAGGRALFVRRLRELGPVGRGERVVLAVFGLTAALWIFRSALADWLGLSGVTDATVAIFGALLLFVIPVNPRERTFAMDWRTAVKLPWGVLILFGGGLTLAGAVTSTGLDVWIGNSLTGLGEPPEWLLILAVATLVIMMTELTSNTATASALLPVLAAAAPALGVEPERLMIPAALAASCAFMLPVATPPNAIVFGSGMVSIRQMASAGLWLNMIAAVLITLASMALGDTVLG